MSKTHELEKVAAAYAQQAIKFDQQGDKAQAITLYRKAAEILLQLAMQHATYGPNKVYLQRAIAYQERIKTLQMSKP